MARKPDNKKTKSPPVSIIPLNPPELENFVRIYRDTFDGVKAAESAGYENPKKIWPELLANEDVQARLRGYRAGVDVPARTPTAMFEHMFTKAFSAENNILVPDVITGEIRIDWEQALAQDPGAIEFDQTISDRGGLPQRTTRLRKRSSLDTFQVVSRNLGEIETGAITQEMANRKFIEHLMKNATTMPVATADPAYRAARQKEREERDQAVRTAAAQKDDR